MYATMCDSACGCAVQSLLPSGSYYTSLDLSVKFLRPITASTADCQTGSRMCNTVLPRAESASPAAFEA